VSRDRIDWLFERALEDGRVPAEASPGERLEVERLLSAARAVRGAAAASAGEAELAMARARVRFGQVLAGSAASARRTRPWSARPLGPAAWAGAAAVLVVLLGLAAIVVLSGGGAETAVALEPGDYVQVQGTVESTSETPAGRTLRLATPMGPVEVVVAAGTPLTVRGQRRPLSELSPGAGLVIAGLVADDRTLRAESLALGTVSPHPPGRLERLEHDRGRFTGEVVSLALAPDGEASRIVVVGPGGRRILVTLDREAAASLLEQGPSAPGRRVSIDRDQTGNVVVALETAEGAPPARPGLFEVTGVISAVTDDGFEVAARGGVVTVVVQETTRVVRGDRQAGPGMQVGQAVAVSGAQHDGVLVADLVVLGRVRGHGAPR
jgi:hypothetical protein